MLAGLSEKVGAAAHIEFYIKILKQKTIQRDLITASYDILRDAYDESVGVDDLIDKAQTKVYDAIQSNVRKEVQDIGSIISSPAQSSMNGWYRQSRQTAHHPLIHMKRKSMVCMSARFFSFDSRAMLLPTPPAMEVLTTARIMTTASIT